jgi:class 3 adenylate cyclase
MPELTVRVPLWSKLGLWFGGAYGLFVVSYGLWDWSALVEEENARRQAELQTLASVIAKGIDGDAHATFRDESARANPEFAAVTDALRFAIEESGSVTWAGTCARDDHGHWYYVVDGARSAPYPVGFPVFDGIRDRNDALDFGEPVYLDALQDDAGTWHVALAPIRSADGAVVGLVELDCDADAESLVLSGLYRRKVIEFAAAVVCGLLLSAAFGRLLSRDLKELVRAALAVAQGQLETRVSVTTRDEIGVLAASFNRMVEGLREREFIRDTFGRFVNPEVVSQILADRSKLALGGETRLVTVLMSDLRGFTALSEELGPERMVALLNRYLARMTAVVERYDGNVAELLGDGIVVLFGAPVAHADDARRAIACAIAMHLELAAFNAEEGRRLQMGIGLDTGAVIAGNIGAERHMKYGVVGAAINVAARLESFTLGNQVLVSQATRDAAGPDLLLDDALELRAKGRRAPLKAYPVRAVGDLHMPGDSAQLRVEVDLPATLWRVDGKQVEEEGHSGSVVALEPTSAGIRTALALSERDAIKLSFTLEHHSLDEIYAVVERVGPVAVLVRFTSVPTGARAALDAYLSERAGEATGPRLP